MADVKNYMIGNDQTTIDQVEQIAACEAYKDSKIRIMPDAHAGKGCVVGTTATFTDKVCPNTVGVDIACRVSAFNFGNEGGIWDKQMLREFDDAVNRYVPAGFSARDREDFNSEVFPYENLRCWDKIQNKGHIRKSMGTLGGGNHYCELDKDSYGEVWFVIHCGSRNLGKQICEHYQSLAVPSDSPKDLWHIEGQVLEDYLNDMRLCNLWSYYNHLAIYDAISERLGFAPSSLFSDQEKNEYQMITCIHNYVDVDNRVIRKGAISAQKDELGLIPLNMRDGLLIVKGRGDEDWNCSLPHGAGRQLSRSKARRTLGLDDYRNVMNGVFSTSIGESTIDEAPAAYKKAADIKKAIEPNGTIIDHLLPIYNFKAH